MRKRADLIIE